MNDHDLDAVLRRMCPQGYALARFEHGQPLMRIGVNELISNPQLAVEALGPQGAKALARALLAVGQQHVVVAECMSKLADEKAAKAGGPAPPVRGLRRRIRGGPSQAAVRRLGEGEG
jgi:hypothetical protein